MIAIVVSKLISSDSKVSEVSPDLFHDILVLAFQKEIAGIAYMFLELILCSKCMYILK